jgi:hypothetical protein
MKTLLELTEELQGIDPDKSENVTAFEGLLAEVIALRTPDSIVPLLGLFRDNAQYDELMFLIIHGLEIFDDKAYVSEIIRGAPLLCRKSPRWASIIFMRVLNSEPTRLELVRQLRDADPDTKAAIKLLMEKINARSVQFLPKTTAVLVAAS